MNRIINKRAAKTAGFILSYIAVGFIFIFIFEFAINKKNNSPSDTSSALIAAIESYYGEWEIVEDFGYHGIHRTTEREIFEVGQILTFNEEVYRCGDFIDVSYPRIEMEITDSPRMEQFDRMEYPHHMGFGIDELFMRYAKIIISESGKGDVDYFYILSDTELILEGDVHRYYRAVKVS